MDRGQVDDRLIDDSVRPWVNRSVAPLQRLVDALLWSFVNRWVVAFMVESFVNRWAAAFVIELGTRCARG